MAVAIAGAVAIAIEDLQVAGSHLPGDAAALIAAIFSATNLLCVEQLRVKFSVVVHT